MGVQIFRYRPRVTLHDTVSVNGAETASSASLLPASSIVEYLGRTSTVIKRSSTTRQFW